MWFENYEKINRKDNDLGILDNIVCKIEKQTKNEKNSKTSNF